MAAFCRKCGRGHVGACVPPPLKLKLSLFVPHTNELVDSAGRPIEFVSAELQTKAGHLSVVVLTIPATEFDLTLLPTTFDPPPPITRPPHLG